VTEPYNSPPCFLHELDPSYLGYANRDEVLSLLNELLEAERAGVKVAVRLSQDASESAVDAALQALAIDEARFCAMLCRRSSVSAERRRGRLAISTTR
jgi:hypothetical protein